MFGALDRTDTPGSAGELDSSNAPTVDSPRVALIFMLQTLTLAGLCSGLTEAIVINPFEVVKVKLQAERGSFHEVR